MILYHSISLHLPPNYGLGAKKTLLKKKADKGTILVLIFLYMYTMYYVHITPLYILSPDAE